MLSGRFDDEDGAAVDSLFGEGPNHEDNYSMMQFVV